MKTLTMMFGFAVLATGCVTDDEMLEGDEDGEGGGKADGTETPGTLAAKYGLELTSTMKLEDTRETGAARFSTFKLRARAKVTTTQEGEDIKLTVKLCDVALPEVSGYQPELDAAFVAGLAAFDVTGTLGLQGEGDAAAITLETDPAALVLGAKLADPIANRLPAAGTDTRVRDQDQDGNPGVSISIPGYGKIFAAMRVKLAINAKVTTSSTISGAAEITLDQAIYGDNIFFYDAASAAAESAAAIRVVTASNTFRMKSGKTTCAQVVAAFP